MSTCSIAVLLRYPAKDTEHGFCWCWRFEHRIANWQWLMGIKHLTSTGKQADWVDRLGGTIITTVVNWSNTCTTPNKAEPNRWSIFLSTSESNSGFNPLQQISFYHLQFFQTCRHGWTEACDKAASSADGSAKVTDNDLNLLCQRRS